MQAQQQLQRRRFLNVVAAQGTALVQLFAAVNESLLGTRNAFPDFNLVHDSSDGVG